MGIGRKMAFRLSKQATKVEISSSFFPPGTVRLSIHNEANGSPSL
ncbi:hypothetical protein LINPERPRIM_LOCUS31415 [Linum perenne]